LRLHALHRLLLSQRVSSHETLASHVPRDVNSPNFIALVVPPSFEENSRLDNNNLGALLLYSQQLLLEQLPNSRPHNSRQSLSRSCVCEHYSTMCGTVNARFYGSNTVTNIATLVSNEHEHDGMLKLPADLDRYRQIIEATKLRRSLPAWMSCSWNAGMYRSSPMEESQAAISDEPGRTPEEKEVAGCCWS
jgi:hypothetical protein